MGRPCGEPGEIKKNTHPKYFTALFREQVNVGASFHGSGVDFQHSFDAGGEAGGWGTLKPFASMKGGTLSPMNEEGTLPRAGQEEGRYYFTGGSFFLISLQLGGQAPHVL